VAASRAAQLAMKILALVVLVSCAALVVAQDRADETQSSSVLHHATRDGRAEIVAEWIHFGKGLDGPDDNGRTALSLAAAGGRLEIARMLLAAGARTDIGFRASEGGLLHVLAKHESSEVLDLALAKEGAIDAREPGHERTPLHIAAMYDHERMCAALLDRGAAIEAIDTNGRTPLHLACLFGAAESARLLIARGANLHAQDQIGDSPLHLCAYDGHAAVASAIFLDVTRRDIPLRKALGDARNVHGWTPLHVAIAGDHVSCAAVLRSFGSGGEPRTARGATLSLLAARFGATQALQWLGDSPDSSESDRLGRTPIDVLDEVLSPMRPWPAPLAGGAAAALSGRIHATPSNDPSIAEPVLYVSPDAGYSITMFDSLLCAVWADGVVVFSENWRQGGAQRRVGWIGPERVQLLVDELEEAGFFDGDDWSRVGMHEGSISIVARRGEAWRSRTYDLRFDPTWAMESRDEAIDPVLLATWRWSRALAEGCLPRESVRLSSLSDGRSFRRAAQLGFTWHPEQKR
jgi:ankyrin repeat protein